MHQVVNIISFQVISIFRLHKNSIGYIFEWILLLESVHYIMYYNIYKFITNA